MRDASVPELSDVMGSLRIYDHAGSANQRRAVLGLLWDHLRRVEGSGSPTATPDVLEVGYGIVFVLRLWGMVDDARSLMTQLVGHVDVVRALQESLLADRRSVAAGAGGKHDSDTHDNRDSEESDSDEDCGSECGGCSGRVRLSIPNYATLLSACDSTLSKLGLPLSKALAAPATVAGYSAP